MVSPLAGFLPAPLVDPASKVSFVHAVEKGGGLLVDRSGAHLVLRVDHAGLYPGQMREPQVPEGAPSAQQHVDDDSKGRPAKEVIGVLQARGGEGCSRRGEGP
jgi:hypothetical protein